MGKRVWLGVGVIALAAAVAAGLRLRSREALPSSGLAPTAQPAAAAELRLTRAEGSVLIHFAEDAEGRFVRAEPGTPLGGGDILETGADGFAELAMDGGSLMELGPNTYFIVEALQQRDTSFYLRLGSVVAQLFLGDGASLRIETPTAVAAVRGTELAVERRPNEPFTRVAVFRKGRVAVRTRQAGATLELNPGQEATVGMGAVPAQPQPLTELKRLAPRLDVLEARRPAVTQAWSELTAEVKTERRQQGMAAAKVPRAEIKPAEPPQAQEAQANQERAPDDPMRALRDKMRKEVRGKIKRDQSLEPLRDKMRKEVQKKLKKERRKKEAP